MISEATGSDRVIDFPALRAAGCPFDPPPDYRQESCPGPVVRARLWDGSLCTLVTGYEHVRSLLGDRRLSADVRAPGFPLLSRSRHELLGRSTVSFIRLDDAEHVRQRRMLMGGFIARRVEEMRPRMRQVVDETLDAFVEEGGPADLVAGFAVPVASRVIFELLGLPYEDRGFLLEHSRVMSRLDPDLDVLEAAIAALTEYLTDLAAHKRRSPDESVLGRLAMREDVAAEELASMGRLLLTAGHWTTVDMTALGVLALLRHPVQADLLRVDGDLATGAVEELLRYLSILQIGVPRAALEDIEIDGTVIRAGEGVMLMLSTANRDAGMFPDGDRLDLTRDTRHHLAFSFGPHQCLGQALARAELQIALPTLLRRLPGLRLATPFEELCFQEDMVYGVDRLPVAW
ncbi:cytochrome P450 [Streptomyces sp. NPDC007076]|uniref:cytochrome P450 n=1 Tax=unclassified Streptomyces TaxID=2593676 RepID=UPI0033E5CF0F